METLFAPLANAIMNGDYHIMMGYIMIGLMAGMAIVISMLKLIERGWKVLKKV